MRGPAGSSVPDPEPGLLLHKKKTGRVPKAAFDTTATVFGSVLTKTEIFKSSVNVDIAEPKYIKNMSDSGHKGFRFDESLWSPPVVIPQSLLMGEGVRGGPPRLGTSYD